MIAGRFFRHSVLYALIGISLGIYMAAGHDHVQATTHAHLNLLGFVAMGLYGLFYRAWPEAEYDRLAGVNGAEPVTAAFSFVVVLGMVLFTVIVFRVTRRAI